MTWAGFAMMGGSYLDVEVLVNLHCLPKDEYKLHHACKLPHVSYFLDEWDVSRGFAGFHVAARALETRGTHG